MEAVSWVEVLSRGEVVARHRCTGPVVVIGRGYDNDVVLDDPHVAARHVQLIPQADGMLLAEDLGSVNGLRTRHSGIGVRRLLLNVGEPICIGNTWLRLRTPNEPVEEEKPLRTQAVLWPWTLCLGALLVGITVLDRWLKETRPSKLSDYLGGVVFALGILMVWSGAWALLSRLFTGRSRFALHVFAATLVMLVLEMGNQLSTLAEYSFSTTALSPYTLAAAAALLSGLIYAHLRIVGPGYGRLKALAVIAIPLLIVLPKIPALFENSSGRLHVLTTLEPPALRLVSPDTETAFFAKAAELKAELDRGRVEEKPLAPSFGLLLDEDD